jgi:dihydroxy-acid dehydratase
MLNFTGRAQVFNSQYDAIQALASNKIKSGEIVVIRYEGPKGAPGMPENHSFTELLYARRDITKVAMMTDGRFSGASMGPCIGHVCPEAYVGGPIAIVENGDQITIDIPNRRLDIGLTEDIIKERFKKWKPIEHEVKSKVLLKYRNSVTSASKGAILKY